MEKREEKSVKTRKKNSKGRFDRCEKLFILCVKLCRKKYFKMRKGLSYLFVSSFWEVGMGRNGRLQPTSADISRFQPTSADFFQPTSADIQLTSSRHLADIWMESADVGRKSAESRLRSAGKKSRWRSASVATLAITLSLGSYFSFSSYQLIVFF